MPDTETVETGPEVTAESLLSLARDFDAGKDIDAPQPPKADAAPDAKPKEEAAAPKAVSDTAKTDKAEQPANTQGDKPKSKWAQSEERKSRTWQEINAAKEALKAEQEAIRREREAFQQAKAGSEALKDESGATAKDYREAAKQFAARGQRDMAEAAEKLAKDLDDKAEQMKQQRVYAEGQEKWLRNLSELQQKHPDLAKPESEMTKATLKVLEQFPMLKQNPDGIKYAVRAAEIELQAREFEGTKAEFAKLKAEHEKLQKKLTLTSGSPTTPVPENTPFEELSHKEQGLALERLVRQHDRDNGLD